MDLREVDCDPGDWIALAEDRDSMVGLCKGGNEPPGSLKLTYCIYANIPRIFFPEF